MAGKAVVCLGFYLLCLASRASGYFVSVDAHAEECFFDRVSSGMKMSLTFEVVEGGFLDIDVKVWTVIARVAEHSDGGLMGRSLLI